MFYLLLLINVKVLILIFIYNIEKGNKVVKGLIGKEDEFHLGIDAAYGTLHEFPLNVNSDVKVNNDEKED